MNSDQKMTLPRWLPLLLLIVTGLLAGSLLHLFLNQPSIVGAPLTHAAMVLPEATVLSDFHLLDGRGQDFDPEHLKNHWSLVFFGYMNCPDICPTTLSFMRQVWQRLRERKANMQRLQLYFVSVDPDRDHLQQLQDYVSYFDPSFIGVTGEADEIDKFTNQAGIFYGFEDADKDTGYYTVNHSVQILLIDPQARLRAFLSPPFDSETIARDLQSIQQYYGDHP